MMATVKQMLGDQSKNEGKSDTVPRELGQEASGSHNGRHDTSPNDTTPMEFEAPSKKCSFKDFNSCKPPTYDGTLDPVVLHNWIIEIEMAFYACQCGDNQRVNFAITTLKESALEWWLETKELMEANDIEKLTWKSFIHRIKERFCTKEEIRELEKKFLELKKEKMTITEYNTKFRKLLSFARRLAPDEVTKVDQYVGGLPWNFRINIGEPTTLDLAMRKARKVEKTLEERDKERSSNTNHKRKNEQDYRRKDVAASKKAKYNDKGKGGDGHAKLKEDLQCFKCGDKGHLANACTKGVKCFNCQQFGHYSNECPLKKKGRNVEEPKKDTSKMKGRAFKITEAEAQEDANVVSVETSPRSKKEQIWS